MKIDEKKSSPRVPEELTFRLIFEKSPPRVEII